MPSRNAVAALLHSDPSLQHRAQAALRLTQSTWAEQAAKPVLEELRQYGQSNVLIGLKALCSLMNTLVVADALVADLMAGLCTDLRAYPAGHAPFRHQYQDGVGVLRLASAGNAALSLVLYEQARGGGAQSVCFTDSECCEIILAGSGDGRMLRLVRSQDEQIHIEQAPLALKRGSRIALAGSNQTKLVDCVNGRLVTLRLSRTSQNPKPSQEFRLSDGALLHRASGDQQHSRQLMALTLLTAMQRGDAAPVMREIACDQISNLRWQAVRHCLALDTAEGLNCLRPIARDTCDPLADQAQALEQHLLAAYSALSQSLKPLCPA